MKTFGRGIFEAEDNMYKGPPLEAYLACLNKMNKEKLVGKRWEKVGQRRWDNSTLLKGLNKDFGIYSEWKWKLPDRCEHKSDMPLML